MTASTARPSPATAHPARPGRRIGSVARNRAGLALLATVLTLVATIGLVGAAPASADVAPMQNRSADLPTAQALPTAQMNGVAWTQLIVGNTVYVGGAFTSARPAGSAAGENETPRGNILAYDLTTGALLPFAPQLNQQVKALAASPDGTRLYVGGNFTSVDGTARYRVAAFDTATGNLVSTWAPTLDYTVGAIVATDTTVYLGGAFSNVKGVSRTRLAAFSARDGSLLDWAPTADNTVSAMIMAPGGSKLIVAGSFTTVNGDPNQYGVVALDPVSGALVPWAVNATVKNGTSTSAILSLSTDGTSVYGGGYTYGKGTLEGIFKADPATGSIEWIEDCHGDTYGVYASSNAVYQVGHAHWCGSLNGFPQPAVWDFRRAIAFSKDAKGTLIHEPFSYTNWAGWNGPSLLSWYPKLDVGTITGKNQAAWTVTGNDQYVVLGGEFPSVNGQPQQGLVRFATTAAGGTNRSPELRGGQFVPTLLSPAPGQVRITFPANWDRDDRTLTYNIVRNGQNSTPIWSATVDSADYDRPAIGVLDTGASPTGVTSYRLQAIDSSGQVTWGDGADIVADGSGAAATAVSAYGQVVKDQGATSYWPLNESPGSPIRDRAGFNDAVAGSGVTAGTDGVVPGDGSLTFNGAAGGDLAASGTLPAPQTFTVQAWFKTTSTRGGRVIGFSDLQTGNSGHRDRQIYLNNTGRVSFGVWSPQVKAAAAVTSAAAYNDGQWHQAVASMGPNGMTLFVDGVKVGARTDVTQGETYPGYWRLGGDNTAGWANAGSSSYLAGSIDEVSVYPGVLTAQQVNAQYSATGRTAKAPADAYGAAVFYDDPTLYWRLGDAATATTAADSASGLNTGGYNGSVTRGAAGAITGTTDTAAAFTSSAAGWVVSNAQFANPTAYSVEAWFKATGNSAQRIIGFGNTKTANSTSYDRHVYLQADGKLAFGGGAASNVVVSPGAYNDGQWHHVVGTQGADGEKLYADGQLVGSNAGATSPAGYTGYWRVGSDRVWNNGTTVTRLNGSVDEAAVYNRVLPGAAVVAHFKAGGGRLPNIAPTAAFTHSEAKNTASFDASGSSDSDGTVTGYAWDFGDGQTGTGKTTTHTYATAGTYTATLTVTDDRGGTATSSAAVSVVANQVPTAAFTATQDFLTTSVDAGGSTDPDGTVTGYAWDFGDGQTGTGKTTTHTYATAGTYTVTLTVTDDDGATATSGRQVTAAEPPNQAPTAAFTASSSFLTASVDASTSTDADGTITGYAWDFGDGQTGTGRTTTHTYATAGTYTVTLTVTDDDGATGQATRTVTVAQNQGPTAKLTVTSNGTTVSVDGGGSADADGTITGYAWDFGDGQTGTGKTTTHTYGALGSYPITLTVTDDQAGTGSTTQQVTLTPAVYARDTFNRTVVNGWGTADLGGPWSVGGGATATGVSTGVGRMSLAAGATRTHTLSSIDQPDVELQASVAADKAPVGGSTLVAVMLRKGSGGEYRSTVTLGTTGTVSIGIERIVGSVSTPLVSPQRIAGLTYAAGDRLQVKFRTVNNATGGVDLAAKIWRTGQPEPTGWSAVAADSSTTAVKTGGQVGVLGYASAKATNAPVGVLWSELTVSAAGGSAG